MIRQDFYIAEYGWHARIYYAVTTYWTERIANDLWDIGCRGNSLAKAVRNLKAGDLNTGITYSNFQDGETVMVISRTSSPAGRQPGTATDTIQAPPVVTTTVGYGELEPLSVVGASLSGGSEDKESPPTLIHHLEFLSTIRAYDIIPFFFE